MKFWAESREKSLKLKGKKLKTQGKKLKVWEALASYVYPSDVKKNACFNPYLFSVLLCSIVCGECPVVGLVEEEIFEFLVVVQCPLQLLQLGSIGSGILVISLLK